MYATKTKEDGFISFHSISFPSEWGAKEFRPLYIMALVEFPFN